MAVTGGRGFPPSWMGLQLVLADGNRDHGDLAHPPQLGGRKHSKSTCFLRTLSGAPGHHMGAAPHVVCIRSLEKQFNFD